MLMPPTNPRKRPAPGSSPVPQMQPQQFTAPSQLTNDQFLRWSQTGDNTNYAEPYNMNAFVPNAASGFPSQQTVQTSSTQLTRRPLNRQIVSSVPRTTFDNPNDPWGAFGDDNLLGTPNSTGMEETDNIELLEEKAVTAKREAQAKRKQIPPFVQKLSSFLDESKNADLIRWSERGDSFIVLDEDEFAKTLIPELFKHKNYASFVRQLNMYGFHKRVGLSDNSMKASERKNKTPSEYYNPYFKRGHPNLLWLINKPKGGSGEKKAKGATRTKQEDGGDGGTDDEQDGIEDTFGSGYGQSNGPGGSRALSTAPESQQLARRDIAVVQHQLQEIQKQQGAISNAISRLRKDHNQLYQQAVAFQTLHDRHESSINAILTFLATVYNRSLEGQGGPNIAQMFANAIPQEQQQGSVVDIGDLRTQQQQQNPGNLSPHRKQQRLLMAPPTNGTPQNHMQGAVSGGSYQNLNTPQNRTIEELFETSPAESPQVKSEIDPLPQQQSMMNIINNTNAQGPRPGSKAMAFPDVLSHFENSNGNSPLTSEQRSDMLQMIAGTASTPGANNALVSPTPPPAPTLEQLGYTQAEIDELVRMQQEQEAKLHEVSSLLQPLSPSGSIPGLNDNQYFPDTSASPSGGGNLDLDQYLDTGAYYTNGDTNDYNFDGLGFSNTDPNSFDFGLEGTNDTADTGRIIETTGSASSENHSPEDLNLAEENQSGEQKSPSKRRRKG